jgi:hypothetical protein
MDEYIKLSLAKSILNFWWVKHEAIKLGRLKTIAESDSYIQDRDKFVGVTLECRKGRVIVNCDRPQAIRNYVLKILSFASNLPDEGRALFLLRDGPTRFSFSYIGIRKFTDATQKLESDYQEIKAFLVKLKNTIKLANRIAPLIPELENYYYFDRNKHGLRIEFKGISREGITTNQVLNSAVTVTGLPGKRMFVPGIWLSEDKIPPQNSPQQNLLRYVDRQILSRRRAT